MVPDVTAARDTAWMATERGSRRAAAAKETVEGSLIDVSECSSGESEAGNSLIAPLSWVINPLLQGPLEVRYTLRRTPKPHLLAQVISASSADSAVATRNANLECDAIAEGEILHVRAHGDDDTG